MIRKLFLGALIPIGSSLLILFALQRPAFADVCSWTAASGNWNASGNWSCGLVPGANDTAIINSGGTVSVTSNVTVLNLTLNGGYLIVDAGLTTTNASLSWPSALQGSGAITVTGSMTWTNGTMSGSGVTTIAPGATLTINPSGSNALDGRTLNNAGTTILTGTSPLYLYNEAALNNSGTFEVRNDQDFASVNGLGVFSNTGILRKIDGAGLSEIGVLLNNSGTVEVQAGTFRLIWGGTSTGGTFSLATGATLEFQLSYPYTLDAASSVTGSGAVHVANGTVNLAGTYHISGPTSITGGVLNVDSSASATVPTLILSWPGSLQGSGAITVTGSMTWTNGTMSGSGVTTIAPGATLTINPSGSNALDGRTLNNAGTTILTGTYPLYLYNGATINNSGMFEVLNDQGISSANAPNTFNNTAFFYKIGSFGMSDIDVIFNNLGAVEVQAGMLRFGDSYAQTAGTTMLNGGQLSRVPGAAIRTFIFDGGLLTGTGIITGEVLNVGGTVAPGNSPGALRIVGNYTQGPTATLNIELGGTLSGTQYDLLDVTGAATFSGTLNVGLINGFTPISGTVFRIVDFGSRSGDFSTENGLNPGGGLFLIPFYSPDNLALIAGATVADLGINLTDGKSWVIPGTSITYTIVVTNAGPDAATGAIITDTFPDMITGVTWTCVASNGSCGAPNGSGNINTTVTLSAGGIITITANGLVATGAVGTLTNAAHVTYSADPNPGNNSALDSDTVLHIKLYLPLVIK